MMDTMSGDKVPNRQRHDENHPPLDRLRHRLVAGASEHALRKDRNGNRLAEAHWCGRWKLLARQRSERGLRRLGCSQRADARLESTTSMP